MSWGWGSSFAARAMVRQCPALRQALRERARRRRFDAHVREALALIRVTR